MVVVQRYAFEKQEEGVLYACWLYPGIDFRTEHGTAKDGFSKVQYEGDVVYVSELARLARNLSDLLTITKEFQEKGVQLVSDKENIDTSSATGRLVFHMIASLAEFERDLIRERQAEGIAAAKEAGKNIGRPRREFAQDEFNECYSLYQQRRLTVTDMAKRLGVSRATVYRLIENKKKINNEIINKSKNDIQ